MICAIEKKWIRTRRAGGGRVIILIGMMKVSFIEKVIFEQRLGGEEGMNHVDIGGKSMPEKRNR